MKTINHSGFLVYRSDFLIYHPILQIFSKYEFLNRNQPVFRFIQFSQKPASRFSLIFESMDSLHLSNVVQPH
jgi:hypothetical protein